MVLWSLKTVYTKATAELMYCTEWRLVWPPPHADIAYFGNFSHSWHETFIGSHIQNGLFFLPIYSLSFFNIFFLQRNYCSP